MVSKKEAIRASLISGLIIAAIAYGVMTSMPNNDLIYNVAIIGGASAGFAYYGMVKGF